MVKPLYLPTTKTEFTTIPFSIPKTWATALTTQAKQLGLSRNSAMQMAVRFGAPLVEAHLQLMRKTLIENCRKIAEGKAEISKILGGSQESNPVRQRASERKRKQAVRA